MVFWVSLFDYVDVFFLCRGFYDFFFYFVGRGGDVIVVFGVCYWVEVAEGERGYLEFYLFDFEGCRCVFVFFGVIFVWVWWR